MLVCRILDRVHDVLITRAATEVPRNPLANLLFRRLRVVVEQIDGGRVHARRAVAALQSVLLPEAFLQWVQLIALGQAFDRHDFGAVRLDREDRAGFGASAVDEHRAGAALTRIAADVRAGEVEVFAQEVDEEHAWLHVPFADLAVHCD